ncbi:hypothetical protein AMECASPLE_021626 [Ameca splendens]|uniref:Uncharacterized protein n=1 Tax=Ameca splendens TaxID=208324 RepID=A0ABV0ZZU1_9TELE
MKKQLVSVNNTNCMTHLNSKMCRVTFGMFLPANQHLCSYVMLTLAEPQDQSARCAVTRLSALALPRIDFPGFSSSHSYLDLLSHRMTQIMVKIASFFFR